MDNRKTVLTALFIALSAVGGMVKIPSPIGTIAFDSLPGYLSGAIFCGWQGAVIGALGHLFSSWSVGYPLGLPIHLFIALQMAIYVSIFGYLYKKGKKFFAVFLAVLLNGILAPALLIPFLGFGVFTGLVIYLIIGSFLNILLATILANTGFFKKVV